MAKKSDQLNIRRRLHPRLYDFSYLWCRSHIQTLKHMAHLLYQNKSKPTVLDIGCGGKPLRPYFPDAHYLGLDISPDSSADIFADCSVGHLPLADNSIDAVVMSNSLEHIYDSKIICNEIERVLRPNGLLYFSVPMTYPVHAHPHDYYRFTRYYFERTFSTWDIIELNATNSLFSTPFLLGGQILASFFPRLLLFIPLLITNTLSLFLDYTTKFLITCSRSKILLRAYKSCPMELNGILRNRSTSGKS